MKDMPGPAGAETGTLAVCALMLSLVSTGCATAPPAAVTSTPEPERTVSSAPTPAPDPYMFPIKDGVIPAKSRLLPNAPRSYRGGIHQGIDVFTKTDGTTISCGEPVLNARRGVVIRADREWTPVLAEEYDNIAEESRNDGDDPYLDRFRGRQVWVRDRDGAVYRYCHLDEIDPAIRTGVSIAPGTRIGTVGNTGTRAGSRETTRNCHLHFEIWPRPDAYLGEGLPPREARKLFGEIFPEAVASPRPSGGGNPAPGN